MYKYEEVKPAIFTEAGQRMFLEIRDQAIRKARIAGAVSMEAATEGICGDSWNQLACVDRLVELGELLEIPQEDCAGQHRIFVLTHRLPY